MRPQLEVGSAFVRARLRRFAARGRLEAYQRRRFAFQLARIRRTIPYYAERADAPWDRLPIVDRATVLAHFGAMNALGLGLEEARALALRAEAGGRTPELRGHTVGLSSGTAAGPEGRGVFLTSARERWLWAGTILAKLLPSVWRRPERVALFLRANSALYGSVRSARVRFAYFDLATPTERQLAELNRFRPTVLVGPPSRLRALAERNDDLTFAPRALFAGSEVLDPIDRSAIRAGFGLDPGEIYQATEGFLGASCRRGTLHLNEDLLVVEREPVAGGGGRFVPIVTDLFRTAQPVVRYRLDDLLYEVACDCGSPRAAVRVEGRVGDALRFVDADGEERHLFPDEVRALATQPGVEQYLVRQTDPTRIEVALRPHAPDTDASVRAAFERRLTALRVRTIRLDIVPYRDGDGAVKLRRVARVQP